MICVFHAMSVAFLLTAALFIPVVRAMKDPDKMDLTRAGAMLALSGWFVLVAKYLWQ